MADIPKNNPMSGSAPCALYYFPEIPSGIERDTKAGRSHAQFISGTPRHHEDLASMHAGGNQNDTSDVANLIEEAFGKGLEQGRAETVATLQGRMETAVSAFNAAVKTMTQTHQQNLLRMEMETVRLALAIAKKIVGRETEHAPVIQHVLRMAMEKIADPRHLTLRLHPEDIEAVESIKTELVQIEDGDMTLRIQPDGTIQKGGCIIETQLGDVDARIDQQIKMIETMLTDQLTTSPNES